MGIGFYEKAQPMHYYAELSPQVCRSAQFDDLRHLRKRRLALRFESRTEFP